MGEVISREEMRKLLHAQPSQTNWFALPGSQRKFLSLRQCPFPNEAPRAFFEVLYEGTRGPGKTDTLIMDFLQDVDTGLGAAWKGILFRQTYKQLQDVIAKTLKWFPLLAKGKGATYNRSEHTWTFPGGEQLLLRQFQRESDYWNYHGHEYPWVGWEELCNWADPNGYKRMMSTCRSSHPKVAKLIRYRATTNPYGPGHNWVKHRFQLPGMRNRMILNAVDKDGHPEPERMALHGHISENIILLKSDPGYIQRIRASARNPAELAAWLDGSWDIVAGGMIDDVWDEKQHVVKPFKIPRTWRLDRSFDWGSSRPFSVGWWAESDGSDYVDANGRWRSSVRGDLFRIYEWYGWTGEPNEGLKMLARDIAKGIVDREVRWGLHGRVEAGPADSSIFDVENGNCIADDMAEKVRLDDGREFRGVEWERADKSPGSRKNGWEQLRARLKAGLRPPVGVREEPGLFIFSTCDQFTRTVPVLPRDDKDPDDVDTDAEDHVADEVRYRIRAVKHPSGSGRVSGTY